MKNSKNVPTAVRLRSTGKVVTREDILAELEDGVQRHDLAKKLGIGAETLRQLMKLFDLKRARARVNKTLEPVFESNQLEAVEEATPEVKKEVEAVIPEFGGRKKRKRAKKVFDNGPKRFEAKPVVTEDKLEVKPTAKQLYPDISEEKLQEKLDHVIHLRDELAKTLNSLISVTKKISQLEEINLN